MGGGDGWGKGGGAGRECEAGNTSFISQFKLEDCGTRNGVSAVSKWNAIESKISEF